MLDAVYVREVPEGDLLIVEGAQAGSSDEMYVVAYGEFEVLQKLKGVNIKVNQKGPGDIFGEVALFMNTKRTATVAAVRKSTVYVVERSAFRKNLQNQQDAQSSQIELFLNSVPLLKTLTREERVQLCDAFEKVTYDPGQVVIKQGDEGDEFYVVMDGEAEVFEREGRAEKKVNHLTKADFFGERALLKNEARMATVIALTKLTVLVLKRNVFTNVLGPLHEIMEREKSDAVVQKRLSMLVKGHPESDIKFSDLKQDHLLGYGAFSAVFLCRDSKRNRRYALKRMRKMDVVHCASHVYCEQKITRSLQHPFIIRQYATFQDASYLYMLFDYVENGDLKDALLHVSQMSEPAKICGCISSGGEGVLTGMKEKQARFYVASIAMVLDYMHNLRVVYRDLKPENVLLDAQGYIKMGDFGFAKVLEDRNRTYTFCGTPGYVAPENVLATGYNTAVDWWSLGVLIYVLLCVKQPFGDPSEDPLTIMLRIINTSFEVQYPSFLSTDAVNVITRFLQRKPSMRLGATREGLKAIKSHPWFAGFDWDLLEARKMTPAIDPKLLVRDTRRLQAFEDDKKPPKPSAKADRVFSDF